MLLFKLEAQPKTRFISTGGLENTLEIASRHLDKLHLQIVTDKKKLLAPTQPGISGIPGLVPAISYMAVAANSYQLLANYLEPEGTLLFFSREKTFPVDKDAIRTFASESASTLSYLTILLRDHGDDYRISTAKKWIDDSISELTALARDPVKSPAA